MPRGPERKIPLPHLTLFVDIEAEDIEWAWPGYLPWGKLVIVDGDPGVGKSLVTVDLAARLSSGGDWPTGEPCERSCVVFLAEEDGAGDTVKPRLVAARADSAVIANFDSELGDGEAMFCLPSSADRLQAAIEALQKQTRLSRCAVFIDPITAYLDAHISGNNDPHVRRVTKSLTRIAKDAGALIVLVRHLNKSVNVSNSKYRGTGSPAWIAAARVGLGVGNHPKVKGRKLLAMTKTNITGDSPSLGFEIVVRDGDSAPTVSWLGVDSATAEELFADARTLAPARDEARRILERLLDANGGEVCSTDALDQGIQAGLSSRSIQRAREKLDLRIEKRKGADGNYHSMWSRP